MTNDQWQYVSWGQKYGIGLSKVTLVVNVWNKNFCPPAQGLSSCTSRLCVCGMSSLEILGGVILAPGLNLDLENFHLTLLFSARPLYSFSSSALAVWSPTLKVRKEKEKLCDPWKISLRTKPSQTPPCFVPSAILKSVFFGLSSVGFSQLGRYPDSQQSCWVAMPQSDFEVCYCSLKSFF